MVAPSGNPAAQAQAQPSVSRSSSFTPGQLETLRQQIFAFKSLKKGVAITPATLALTKPPPLHPPPVQSQYPAQVQQVAQGVPPRTQVTITQAARPYPPLQVYFKLLYEEEMSQEYISSSPYARVDDCHLEALNHM